MGYKFIPQGGQRTGIHLVVDLLHLSKGYKECRGTVCGPFCQGSVSGAGVGFYLIGKAVIDAHHSVGMGSAVCQGLLLLDIPVRHGQGEILIQRGSGAYLQSQHVPDLKSNTAVVGEVLGQQDLRVILRKSPGQKVHSHKILQVVGHSFDQQKGFVLVGASDHCPAHLLPGSHVFGQAGLQQGVDLRGVNIAEEGVIGTVFVDLHAL